MKDGWLRRQAGDITYRKGISLYNENGVIAESASESDEFYCTYNIQATVRGTVQDMYYVYIEYDGVGEDIVDEDCSCLAHSKYPGLCKHQVAALKYFMNNYSDLEKRCEEAMFADEAAADDDSYFFNDDYDAWDDSEDYGDYDDDEYYDDDDDFEEDRYPIYTPAKPATTSGLKQLIDNAVAVSPVTFSPVRQENSGDGKIEVVPYLNVNFRGSTLEFKVGNKKKYVLKNIYDFVYQIKNERTYRYGKNLSFKHTMDAFDENSQCIVSYIVNYVNKHPRPSYGYGYYTYYGGVTKTIYMEEDELEQFLDFCDTGTIINLSTPYGREFEPFAITDEVLPRKMVLEQVEAGINLTIAKVEGIICPNAYIYFHKGKIHMDDVRYIKPIKEFLSLMSNRPNRDMFIENTDVPAFCNGFLNTLKEFYEIEYVGFNPAIYELPTPIFKFYLDAPERKYLTARIDAVYGDRTYNVYSINTALRNMVKEKAIADMVSPMFNAFDSDRQELVIAEDEDRIYKFIKEDIDKLKFLGEVFVSDKLKRYMVKTPGNIEVGLSISGNLLDFSINEGTLPYEELAEILSKYDRRKRYYRLRSGEFVDLSNINNLDKTTELIAQLGITDKQLKTGSAKLAKYRALYLDEFERSESFYMDKNDEYISLIHSMENFDTGHYHIPSRQKDVLRGYQKTGYRWLRNMSEHGFGGILADDMGLGKSLQVIAFLQSMAASNHKPTLIVCPASLVYNWGAEFDKFADGLTYILMVGSASTRSLILAEDLKDTVVITSYDLLRRDIEDYSKIDFFCQIIDEAQYIKNHNTQVAHAVKSVNAETRFALTGTPIENRVSELWSIFDYLMPGYLYSYQRFNREFEKPIMNSKEEAASTRLRAMIRPFVLRRLKRDVLTELPDKLEENYVCQMTGEQERLYRAHVDRLRILLDKQSDEEFKKGKIEILSELTKLRQLCCDPSLLYDNYKDASIKTEMCMNLIEDAIDGGHKILLFSQFTSMLDILTAELDKRDISFYLLTGQTPKQTRARMVKDFNEDDTKVFCISLKAGGTGLNLTAADIVIHFDPWWNIAVQNQATDRAHRIGQQNVVTVYRLVAKNTIEERIIELQDQKSRLADSLLSGDDFSSGSFTRQELLDILR